MPIVTRKHRKQPSKHLKRIRAAVQAGQWKKARWLVVQWLRSPEAKRLATRLAYRAMLRHSRPDKSELDQISKHLDAWEGSSEVGYVGRQPKEHKPNDYRLTINFGIENRALQYLLLLVLREVVELHPDQYGNRGGVHPAIKRVVEAMNEGYLWAVEFDIKDFFSSFDGNKALSLLPVPKRVGERVLLAEHLTLLPGPTLIDGCEGDAEHDLLNDELVKVRQGFPQGSAASSFVAEALLADTIHMFSKIGVVVAYLDNILLLTKTKVDAASMFILSSALKAHPAGPFKPTIKHFNAGEPIDFLGHTLTPKNGLIRIDPNDHNRHKLEKLMKRVTSACASLKKTTLQPLTRQKIAQRLQRHVRSRTEWLKLCDGINEIRSQAQAQIKEALMNPVVCKTFKLHPDQKEIVEAALADIKGKTGTAVDTVALEYMAQSYMGTGVMPSLKSVMTVEYKKAGNAEAFITNVLNLGEQITGLTIQVNVDDTN